jgi:RNA-directed DNA polymerase
MYLYEVRRRFDIFDFPSAIAKPSTNDPNAWEPGKKLRKIIASSGFRINATKTHMQYKASRQEVTGLVVNKRINVRQEYRRNVRAMVHSLLNTGQFQLYGTLPNPPTPGKQWAQGRPKQLHGMLGFIDQIDLDHRKSSQDGEPLGKLSGRELMYKRFLIYTNFFAAPAPVIICEGETDNVYLTHAIRSLAANNPQLAAVAPDGKITLLVRLYKYRKSSTARILELGDGGSSRLGAFISAYKKEVSRFRGPGQTNPIIILFDRDSGAGAITGAAAQALGKPVNLNDPFTRVFRNMYVVPTPLPLGAAESKIEDFFDDATKNRVVAGKSFNANNKVDTATQYGKKIFAEQIVKANAKTIDFTRFQPLLSNLAGLIAQH